MIDLMIEMALAILILSAIIILFKYGVGVIGVGYNRLISWMQSMRYPISSDTVPIKAMSFGDVVILNDVTDCRYYGIKNGKHYLEAVKGEPFAGGSFVYADESFLADNVTMIRNRRVTKWKREK